MNNQEPEYRPTEQQSSEYRFPKRWFGNLAAFCGKLVGRAARRTGTAIADGVKAGTVRLADRWRAAPANASPPNWSTMEFAAPPFLYEIRVKGRLSGEQWSSWFDDLTLSTARGESILRGRVPDHAALYALLARLRDLAVPLVAVRVLDAEAQRALHRQSRRYDLMINVLLISVYLALLGGLSAITVFIAPIINVALALTLLFAVLGGLAHAFWLWSDQVAWRWITYFTWPSAAFTFWLYIAVSGLMPTALAIAIMLFLLAGGLFYLIYYLRRRAEGVKGSIVDWESLGSANRPADEDAAVASDRDAHGED